MQLKKIAQQFEDNPKRYSKSGKEIPRYDETGNLIKPEKKINFYLYLNWTPLFITVGVFVLLFASIYLPQFFLPDVDSGALIAQYDADGYNKLQSYIANHGSMDFDNDGFSNVHELDAGTDPFVWDSDADGVMDGKDKEPLIKNETLLYEIQKSGADIKTAYAMAGVILWPANKDAWVNGAVIQERNGYRFTNFEGWAKFPEGGYAYRFENGKHIMLDYKEDAEAWKINGDYVVTLTDEIKEETYRISLFGLQFYLRNGFGKFLADILPDKGWLTGESMWLDDTFIDTQPSVYSNFVKRDIAILNEDRYGLYTTKLNELANVYRALENGQHVLASLNSPRHGESVVEVYGYTYDGHLIVASPKDQEIGGIINIKAHCVRALDIENKITENTYFTFAGCGYSSEEGAYISFFEFGADNNQDDAPSEPSPDAEPVPETTAAPETTATESAAPIETGGDNA